MDEEEEGEQVAFDAPFGSSADAEMVGAGQVAGGLALLVVDVGVAPIDPATDVLGSALVLVGLAQRHRSSIQPWWWVAVLAAAVHLVAALVVAGAGSASAPRRVPTRFDVAGPTWATAFEVLVLLAVVQAFRSSLPADSASRRTWDTTRRLALQVAVPALVVGWAFGRIAGTSTGGALAPLVVLVALASVVPVVHAVVSSVRTARYG